MQLWSPNSSSWSTIRIKYDSESKSWGHGATPRRTSTITRISETTKRKQKNAVKKWASFWDQQTVPISDQTFVLGQCTSILFLRASPFCKSCICMWACAYACVPARAYTQARAPARKHLCQGGRACARSSGRTPAVPTYATRLLVVLAPPRHVGERTGRSRNWCDRNLFLVSPKLIFRKKLDPVFGIRNWPQNLGRKTNMV